LKFLLYTHRSNLKPPERIVMPLVSSSFDLNSVEWRRITDPQCKEFKVDFEYSLLGYDLGTQHLDMLLRYSGGGHCRRHRHVASTVTLVLEGEQFLEEMLPDGTTRSIRRKKGTYALAPADAHPHDEHGGENGGTVLLSMTAGSDGVLFEYFDENMQNPWTVSIDEYVDSWARGMSYGLPTVISTPGNHQFAEPASEPSTVHETVDVRPLLHEDAAQLRESQEVGVGERNLEFLNPHGSGSESSPLSRFNDSKRRETKRNWKVGVSLGIVIAVMLTIAVYFIVGAYDRTLPPADKSFGDMTRPSLR
jgi:hypothetical protein